MENNDGSLAKGVNSGKGAGTPTSLFAYDLPKDLIAQHSAEPRDTARLLVLDRGVGTRTHAEVLDLPKFLRPWDLLVFNDTKVFKARLFAICRGRKIEILLLRAVALEEEGWSRWEALVGAARYVSEGDEMLCEGTSMRLVKKQGEESPAVLEIREPVSHVLALCDRVGHIPVPPYVKKEPASLDLYQTSYAKVTGSVAAPTSGFHFTPRLFRRIRDAGVEKAFVTLHVGIGTFVPVKTETLEEHRMHAEWVSVPQETVEAIRRTKEHGGRVIAVGTTTARTLEGVAEKFDELRPFEGEVNLFIKPGFSFRVMDGLFTNFHLPCSTLLALVSAFAGRERVLAAYREAVEKRYRFFSFGDAMLIV